MKFSELSERDEQILKVLQESKKDMFHKDIVKATEISGGTVTQRLDLLTTEAKGYKVKKVKHKKTWKYRINPEQPYAS